MRIMPIDDDFYTCDICGVQFDEGSPYSSHMDRHQINDEECQ
jgi:hypothetical protein